MSGQDNFYQKISKEENHYTTIEEIHKKPRKYGFIESLESIKNHGYYWGPITSETAYKLLKNQPDGTFIVRDSFNLNYIFALTFKNENSIYHIHLQQYKGAFSFGYSPEGFSNITDLIEKTVEMSKNGNYLLLKNRDIPFKITNPLSRFQKVQSLKHISRYYVIKYLMRWDCIDQLDGLIPKSMLEYLRDKKYLYDEEGYGIDFENNTPMQK